MSFYDANHNQLPQYNIYLDDNPNIRWKPVIKNYIPQIRKAVWAIPIVFTLLFLITSFLGLLRHIGRCASDNLLALAWEEVTLSEKWNVNAIVNTYKRIETNISN